jgi:E3 ubiquitin-protein ligase HERC2
MSITGVRRITIVYYRSKWNIYVYYRGKGDNYRLGHGTEEHIRIPKQIEHFGGKKVVDISVGSMHCLAVTFSEDGDVYGWGRNEQGQLGDISVQYRTEPTLLSGLEGKKIIGAACGPSQVCSCLV